jgi:hypothetical protein
MHDTHPAPNSEIPRDLYYQIVHAVCRALPPPAIASPEEQAHHHSVLIAQVVSLRPATPDEVTLATQYIAAAVLALDCVRLAQENAANVSLATKCTAQAGTMMRQSLGARAQLLRAQAARQTDQPARQTNQPAPTPAATPPARTPEDLSGNFTAAEKYALENPGRAALIRSLGRLPKKFDGGMCPEMVHEIVNSPSPILQGLHKKPPHHLAAARSGASQGQMATAMAG